MADSKESSHYVPGWDGSAKSWRRYAREVVWFVRSTPVSKRRYCAAKLLSRLTGPARLLAMSWPVTNFEEDDGIQQYMRKLASSPLVRQSLPNAAAICGQYFSFARRSQEPISNFLVREALCYSEFVEALIRLREEQLGVKQEDRDFGLPKVTEEDDWEDWYGSWPAEPEEADQDVPPGFSPTPSMARSFAAGSPGPGSQPSRGSPPATGSQKSTTVVTSKESDITEMTLADSFVLGVLRGFRLLQSAGLSPDERRDIIGATKGSLEFEKVTHALQTLWDDQLSGRQAFGGDTNFLHHQEAFDPSSWDDRHAHDPSAAFSAEQGDWDEWAGDWDGWEEFEENFFQGEQDPEPPEDQTPLEEDPALGDAQHAEKVAESLAAEAHRSWTEAQRATQALRRDRGFGHVVQTGSDSRKCFNCGSTRHLARDCPDKSHPGPRMGGKGNLKGFVMEQIMAFYQKGKGKNRGKRAHWMEAQANVKGKMKGKGYSKPSVNSYSAEFFAGGLELQAHPRQSDHQAMSQQLQSERVRTPLPMEKGLLDSGATASAGPQVAVEGLISAVMAKDRQAVVDIMKSERPYFRFGNGRWGRALFKVRISSKCSGDQRAFSIYALPNPPDLHHPDFDQNSLVPILIGMDHLNGPQHAMAIDYATGLAIDSYDKNPVPYLLEANPKGHYVLDIVHHLTRGKTMLDGHACVRVHEDSHHGLDLIEFHTVHELEDFTVVRRDVSPQQLEDGFQRLMRLRACALQSQRDHVSQPPAALPVFMGTSSSNRSQNSKPLTTSSNVDSVQEEHGHRGMPCRNQGEDSIEGSSQTLRSKSADGSRSQRSAKPEDLAVLCSPPTGNLHDESSRSLATLHRLRSEVGLRATSRKPGQQHKDLQPPDGLAHAERAAQVVGRCRSDSGTMPSNAEEDRCRREPEVFAGRAPGSDQGAVREAYFKDETFGIHGKAVRFQEGDIEPCGSDAGTPPDSAEDPFQRKVNFLSNTSTGDPERSGGRCADRRGRECQANLKSMPTYVGFKLMAMAATLTSTMAASLTSLCLDQQDGVWEIACAPHSWLSQACDEQGLQPRRINLQTGYDIYKPETWSQLKALRKVKRPKKIWLSLPCTKFCRWTQVNFNTPEKREVLKSHQRRERKMLWHAVDFIISTLEEDEDVAFYWEWTFPCSGWYEPPLVHLENKLHQRGVPWLQCRIDGCVYGLKDTKNENFLKKKWAIRTTDESFHHRYKTKTCHSLHPHAHIEGIETARSAYYPWQLVKSIAQFWRQQWIPDRVLRQVQRTPRAKEDEALAFAVEQDVLPSEPPQVEIAVPSEAEKEKWQAKIAQYHRSAGHPSNTNMARILKDAGQPPWKIQMVHDYKCQACESIKPGGTSSGQIPPASLQRPYMAWQAVGLDVSEWLVPGTKTKLKFMAAVDLATRLRLVYVLKSYDNMTMQAESAEEVILGLSKTWLMHFPKPEILVADSAKSFTSQKFVDFMSEMNIYLHYPPEKEPWAHGIVESTMQDIKRTATALQQENLDQQPEVTLALAAAALNSTEYTAGYSANQWAFGHSYTWNEEDRLHLHGLSSLQDMTRLLLARQKAEEVALKTRAQRALSKLGNTTVRQPLRQYSPFDLVKVWRRVHPQEQHRGARGGFKKSGRPFWIGPGRVVLQEVLPHQQADDHRRHIVWVLVGSKLLRCSIHSVRPVTEPERLHYELSNQDNPSNWKSLADMLPNREYQDLVDEQPQEDDRELPDLPKEPDKTTYAPIRRASGKKSLGPEDWRVVHRSSPIGQQSSSSKAPPQYLPRPPEPEKPGEEGKSELERNETEERHRFDSNDYSPDGEESHAKKETPEPSSKKARKTKEEFLIETYDLKWIEKLEEDAAKDEAQYDNFYKAFDDSEEVIHIAFDLEFSSQREKKDFIHAPEAYLVRKINTAEVNLKRCNPLEQNLFKNAKGKEVSSFIQNTAVRKCLDDVEVREAYSSGRIVRARWVLVWKAIPPEEQEQAKIDAQKDGSVVHPSGQKKAKARIVLLGFEHPSLTDPTFKTASPVQSTIGRTMLYVMAKHYQWRLQGLDLATAFLQTAPTEADEQLWTVAELKEALDVPQNSVLRVLRNIYGSTTAPRGLWLSLRRTLVDCGGHAALGERCLWLWYSKHELDETGRFPRLIGAMGGHVDDFHRIGDESSEEWNEVCRKIDKAYKWGSIKADNYRFAGCDISTVQNSGGTFGIEVHQDSYIDGLSDLQIDPERFRMEVNLTEKEKGQCRNALGSLQWLAIQTQPQLCARCNLLLTEVVTQGHMSHAREIQGMIMEVRKQRYKLKYFRVPTARTWADLTVISMGDQAHNNRPKGDSTGGLVTLIAGPECLTGQVCPMMLITWKTWKLRRKAIGSNDAEVQSVLEAEDCNFRVRLLWTEINGAGAMRKGPRVDLVQMAESQVKLLRGVLCTDSRGGYDAIERNESPLLGLSNLRAALQAFQLRDNLQRVACDLRWLASDYDLGDALTKKRQECRQGLEYFLRTNRWCIAFDPTFTAAKKNKKTGQTAIARMNQKPNYELANDWELRVQNEATGLAHDQLRELDSEEALLNFSEPSAVLTSDLFFGVMQQLPVRCHHMLDQLIMQLTRTDSCFHVGPKSSLQ